MDSDSDSDSDETASLSSKHGWLPRAEHIWVTNMSITYEQHPGLLLAWRRSSRPEPSRWEGWVIWVQAGIEARGDGPYVRQSWIEASGIKRRE